MSDYFIVLTIDACVMPFVMLFRRKKYNFSFLKSIIVVLVGIVSALLGAKILYIVENFEEFKSVGLIWGGFSFFGAVFGIPIFMLLFSLFFEEKYSEIIDACAPMIALGISIMRIGCYLEGCCGGHSETLFGVSFIWPTQLIEVVLNFLIFITLLIFEKKGLFKNILYPIFIILYCYNRFFLEFLRNTPKNIWIFSNGQIFALIGITISIIVLLIHYLKRKNEIKK